MRYCTSSKCIDIIFTRVEYRLHDRDKCITLHSVSYVSIYATELWPGTTINVIPFACFLSASATSSWTERARALGCNGADE
jgi:hypothetical protein